VAPKDRATLVEATIVDRPKKPCRQEIPMKQLLSRLASQIKKAWNAPTQGRQRCTRPSLEALEDRQVLSTMFVFNPAIPEPNAYGQYNNFGFAYAAARPGDTIQLEPGAFLYNGNTATISKQLTIQGDPNYSALTYKSFYPVYGNVDVTQGGSGTIFKNLNFGSSDLNTDWSTNGVGAELCSLNDVNFNGGGHYWLFTNQIQGGVFISQYQGSGGNTVYGNSFTGHGSLWIQEGVNDLVTGNSFQTSSTTAMTLFGESGWVSNNSISFTNPSSHSTGIFLGSDGGQKTALEIWNNQIQSADRGIGLVSVKYYPSSSMSVDAWNNDFRGNAVGVEVTGDGQSAGTIDLGGGSYSAGGNNFSDYNGSDGRMAIVMENTANNATISAEHNSWANYAPNAIKDGYYNTYRATPDESGYSIGTGWVYT
jgi:hypothetical protein